VWPRHLRGRYSARMVANKRLIHQPESGLA